MIFNKAVVLSIAFLNSYVNYSNAENSNISESSQLSQAKLLRYSQRWFEAAQAYRAFIAKFPMSSRKAEAEFWLAATLEQDQRWDDAAGAYTTFINNHPEQRILRREALLNRIRCWGIRQWDCKDARNSLVESLQSTSPEISICAALQLARSANPSCVSVLQQHLQDPLYAEQCISALQSMNIPIRASDQKTYSLHIRNKSTNSVIMLKFPVHLAHTINNYLTTEQIREAETKGINPRNIKSKILKAAKKGETILTVEDRQTTVTLITD